MDLIGSVSLCADGRVAKISLRFVIYNDNGEVEGVKYDRVGVVLINAVKEQQEQIEAQQKHIGQLQDEIVQLKKKVAEIDEMKAFICKQTPAPLLCKR